jgi:hypothetical protein
VAVDDLAEPAAASFQVEPQLGVEDIVQHLPGGFFSVWRRLCIPAFEQNGQSIAAWLYFDVESVGTAQGRRHDGFRFINAHGEFKEEKISGDPLHQSSLFHVGSYTSVPYKSKKTANYQQLP